MVLEVAGGAGEGNEISGRKSGITKWTLKSHSWNQSEACQTEEFLIRRKLAVIGVD
jgi:hypothetical protein